MSATSFTLYPGAAFIQCESVAEFDPNVKTPPYNEKVVTLIQADDQDPVNKLPIMLKPVYDGIVMPIMEMDYSTTGEAAVAMLDDLHDKVSAIADVMYKCMASQRAANFVYGGNSVDSYINSSYHAHAGTIIKNMSRIKEQGYDSFNWSVSHFGAVDSYYMGNLFTVLNNSPKLLDTVMTTKDLDNISSSQFSDIFPDTKSIVDCLINNAELRCRLEKDDSRETTLRHLISNQFYNYSEVESGREPHETVSMKFLARSLKCILGEIYDIQVDIIDGNVDNQSERIHKVLCRSLNMFNLLVIYVFANAYNLRHSKNYKAALDKFINDILMMLKTAK